MPGKSFVVMDFMTLFDRSRLTKQAMPPSATESIAVPTAHNLSRAALRILLVTLSWTGCQCVYRIRRHERIDSHVSIDYTVPRILNGVLDAPAHVWGVSPEASA